MEYHYDIGGRAGSGVTAVDHAKVLLSYNNILKDWDTDR